MGLGTQPTPGGSSKDLSVQTLIEVNEFMVDEVQGFIKRFQELPNKGSFNMKTTMIALQVFLDSKVLSKFAHSSEDMQAATMGKQEELSKSKKFLDSHQKMQAMMEMFMKTVQK